MKSVICAIVKDEQYYILEWVEYHLNLGFEHIYVFEDYGSGSHKYLFENEPRVTVMPVREFGIKNHANKQTVTQIELYRKFLNEAKQLNLCDWVLFTDIDEFLMFEDGYNLLKIEEEYKDLPGVLLSWRNFGANGHLERPKEKVVDSYTEWNDNMPDQCNKWSVKSLVNVHIAKGLRSCHHVINGVKTNGSRDINSSLCYDKAWINHYHCKSWEDYLDRVFKRGNMSNNQRSLDIFFTCSPEFRPKKMEMIMAVRNRHCNTTMWVSRDLKIISGGNHDRLAELKRRWESRTNIAED